MKRVWHPYWTWEDIGMWRDVTAAQRRKMLPIAIKFTGDHVAYGVAMMRVIEQFPIACEHNLTERSINRQAWIGHAAAYLECELPEYVTREAWGLLTQPQRDLADAAAARAIHEWERRASAPDRSLHPQLGI
jgi:hypothetical protein